MCKFPRGEVSLGDENLALSRNKAYQCTQNDLKGVIKNPLIFVYLQHVQYACLAFGYCRTMDWFFLKYFLFSF